MRQLLWGLWLGLVISASTGCFLPIYSGDPSIRTRQLIFTSENMRAILDEWERIWFLDMPSHLTPRRVHGGIM
jgi:hypothetical protein